MGYWWVATIQKNGVTKQIAAPVGGGPQDHVAVLRQANQDGWSVVASFTGESSDGRYFNGKYAQRYNEVVSGTREFVKEDIKQFQAEGTLPSNVPITPETLVVKQPEPAPTEVVIPVVVGDKVIGVSEGMAQKVEETAAYLEHQARRQEQIEAGLITPNPDMPLPSIYPAPTKNLVITPTEPYPSQTFTSTTTTTTSDIPKVMTTTDNILSVQTTTSKIPSVQTTNFEIPQIKLPSTQGLGLELAAQVLAIEPNQTNMINPITNPIISPNDMNINLEDSLKNLPTYTSTVTTSEKYFQDIEKQQFPLTKLAINTLIPENSGLLGKVGKGIIESFTILPDLLIGSVQGIERKVNEIISMPEGVVEGLSLANLERERKKTLQTFEYAKENPLEVGANILGGIVGGYAAQKISTKVFDTVRTMGMEEIDFSKMTSEDVLSGENIFPEAGSKSMSMEEKAKIHLNLFEEESIRLPNQESPMAFHTTPNEWTNMIAGTGSSETAGVYGSYGVSPHFLEISKEAGFELFGNPQLGIKPTIYAFSPDDMIINPVKPVGGGKFEFVNPTTQGNLYISGLKTEVEGMFPPGTEFANLQKNYYTTIFGRNVPIIEAEAIAGVMSTPSAGGYLNIPSMDLASSLGISPKSYLVTPQSLLASTMSSAINLQLAQPSLTTPSSSKAFTTKGTIQIPKISIAENVGLSSYKTPMQTPTSLYIPEVSKSTVSLIHETSKPSSIKIESISEYKPTTSTISEIKMPSIFSEPASSLAFVPSEIKIPSMLSEVSKPSMISEIPYETPSILNEYPMVSDIITPSKSKIKIPEVSIPEMTSYPSETKSIISEISIPKSSSAPSTPSGLSSYKSMLETSTPSSPSISIPKSYSTPTSIPKSAPSSINIPSITSINIPSITSINIPSYKIPSYRYPTYKTPYRLNIRPLKPTTTKRRDIFKSKTRSQKIGIKGFEVYVRKAGKYVKVTSPPLIKGEAMKLGAMVTERTPRATFKLIPSSFDASTAKIPYYFEPTRFRKPIGRSKLGSDVFIEKNRFRINTPEEFRGITFKGINTPKMFGKQKKKKRKG